MGHHSVTNVAHQRLVTPLAGLLARTQMNDKTCVLSFVTRKQQKVPIVKLIKKKEKRATNIHRRLKLVKIRVNEQ